MEKVFTGISWAQDGRTIEPVFESEEEFEARVRDGLLDHERRAAEAAGRPFDPADPAMLERVDLALIEVLDDAGFLDPIEDPEKQAERNRAAVARLKEWGLPVPEFAEGEASGV